MSVVERTLNRACNEITGFSELLQRFERKISILGRSKRTFENYSRRVAALALHFESLPTDLHPEQVKDYLFELQQRSHSSSQSYFKHTVYGLRFLLNSENLPYDYLHLPSIPKEKKLPVILSREEIWRILQHDGLLFEKNWVVYAKRPLGGPKQVIEYLGRYTHKVAISNHRIKNVTEQEVTISYKDYKDQSKTKQLTLKNEEFTRRFSLHILPKRFVQIRHYGILSSSRKRGKLQRIQKDIKVVRPIIKPKTQHKKCYCCKAGNLITLHVFGQRGPPKAYLIESQIAPVN
ncbi:transposase [Leadbetterella byssophila DSM 17132]|uniref:Transposase n=1 Tax=Leadbetterella byssophila (strain DSM 17132 / JCM 16389 / KACC 11308 / NBRC 106382 / 4M15) TaxID=649349 RepID=E4RRM8_LEAB4|nr:transposase [Leadbetterella byssophila]ADQ16684.1 transposase [Leadbetterella byssophila DSM 17132]